jgi:hypothetical protein
MGLKFCKVLGTATSRNPKWDEALVKLNQLLLQKIKASRSLRVSTNPLDSVDLRHLAAWQDQKDYTKLGDKGFTVSYDSFPESELPTGYAFDRYGLVVSDQFADRPGLAEQAGTQCVTDQPQTSTNTANEDMLSAAAFLTSIHTTTDNGIPSSAYTAPGIESESALLRLSLL